jgi:hypothetical protein
MWAALLLWALCPSPSLVPSHGWEPPRRRRCLGAAWHWAGSKVKGLVLVRSGCGARAVTTWSGRPRARFRR